MKNFLFLISISFCASSFSMEGGLPSPVRSTGSSVGHSSDDLTSLPLTPRTRALANNFLKCHQMIANSLLEESNAEIMFLISLQPRKSLDEDGFDGIDDGAPRVSAVFRAEQDKSIGTNEFKRRSIPLPLGYSVEVDTVLQAGACVATFVGEECKDVVIPPHLQKMLKFFKHCQSYAAKNSASPAPTAPAQATETPK